MEIFSLRILTIVNILQFLRILIIMFIAGIAMCSIFFFKPQDLRNLMFFGSAGIMLFFVKDIFSFLKKIIISRAKHPLPLNLLCNIIELGKPYYFGRENFYLNEIINDNKIPLTLYYINNSQHPILQFNEDKLLFHNREYNWKDLRWRYFLDGLYKYGKSNGKYVIEFEGTDQDNNRIKNKIEFEKVKAKENEVILLFVIHDLLFGKKSAYYY